MTITYHSGERLQGLSSDGGGLSFSDNFSTDDWTTSSSSVIGVSGGVLNWSAPNGSVQEQQAYVDMLGSLINTTQWSIRFKLTVSGYSQGSSAQTQQLFFGISNENSTGHTNTQNIIGLKLTVTSTVNTIGVQMRNATPSNTGNTSNVSTALGTGTWYVEINRLNLTQSKITLYSDSSYSQLVSTATETYSTNALNDLRYLKCSEYSSSAATDHTLSGTIDDVSFYNGLTSIVKPTNVPDGSRFEETDNRKFYTKLTISKSGCLAYYNFEQTSGNLINQATSANGFTDGLGSSEDGVSSGGVGKTNTGKLGSNSWSFDGVDDFVDLQNGTLTTDDWSFIFWIKGDSASQGDSLWQPAGKGTGDTDEVINLWGSGGNIIVEDSATGTISFSLTGIDDGNWHLFAFVVGSGTMTAYVDNVSKGSKSTSTAGTTNTSLFIGKRARSPDFFKGFVDELSTWNRALTPDELSSLYNSGTGSTIDNAIRWQEKGTT